eukprot:GGOE01002560.1.p1 GENE.GGOE01002560.1~~GGOE01002560.1.p1  ORF type:complete len:1214 (+),score=257.79 GGOE01002560.1:274-3642(+)
MANNLLEEYVRKVKDERTPGLVIEYVKTPDGAVIVEETCKRHGLKVNCTLLFDTEDTLVLTSRIKSKGAAGRRIDMNPQYLLGRIQEYMFVEKAFHSHYHNTPGFRVLDASKPLAEVTSEVLEIVNQLNGPTAPSLPLDEAAETTPAPAMNFVPVIAPFLQFVHQKAEMMTLLSAIQNFIGLNVNRDRRFPGSSAMILDEAGLKNICATDHRYVVSKKIIGLRYLLVHLKPDGTRPGGCYLVDRAFAAFRVQLWPAPAEWGDMLLDGTLVVAGGKAVFVVFDCLYFDGIRAIPENLDSRLEYVSKRFSMETAINQLLAQVPQNECAVVCKQYHHIRDLPRLVREFENPDPQAPYQTDGLIFTPKKNGYRTNFDPHLFKWKPVERCTVDFRLTENRHGGHDLSLARPVGKELREMPYDCLDSSVELPAALVGSVVECRPLQKQDSMGMMQTTWQILSIRSDKNTPDREDVATACLQNNITCQRLLMLYHQFSQPQPEVFTGPPVPQAGVMPHMDPTMGHYSPTLGMPIYVGSHLPPGVMGPLPPSMARPYDMMPSTSMLVPPGSMYGTPSMSAMHSSMMGPMPNPMAGAPTFPSQTPLPYGRPFPMGAAMDNVPAPGILSTIPINGRPVVTSMALLPPTTSAMAPMAMHLPHGQHAIPTTQPQGILYQSSEGLAVGPVRDRSFDMDSAVVQYFRTSSPPLPPADSVLVTVGPTISRFEPEAGTPERGRRNSDGQQSGEPCTPPDQHYHVSGMDHLSLTSDPKDTHRAGGWPFFQTPQVQRAPFSSLDFDSHEDRNHALLRMRAFDPSEKENAPHSNLQEVESEEKGSSVTKHSMQAMSPASRVTLSPAFRESLATPKASHRDFLLAVKEWVLRKFVPRPSAAKPRPFNAVDMAIGCGADLPHWDKARCSYLVGLTTDEHSIKECGERTQSRESEMEMDFLSLDFCSEHFRLPDTAKVNKFEVVGMFFCLERAFQSEAKARQAIANAASLLKKGGHLLVLTNDAEVIQKRVAQCGPRTENAVHRLSVQADMAQLAQDAYGVEYSLEYEGSPSQRTFIVPRETLVGLCRDHGLETLPQDHGMFNFEDVASYIEKSVSKGRVWRDLPVADRELVTLWSTAVFQKEV